MGLTLLTTSATILKGRHSNPIIGIDIVTLSQFDIWKIISGNIIFSSVPQMFIGVMLIYSMRQFERQFGIRKFGSYVFLSFVISLFTQCAIITTASSMNFPIRIASGPYFIVYSLLALYYRHIPKLHPSRHAIFGSFRFSEKSWTYVFALQLLCGEGLGSICAGLSGFFAGYVYLSDFLSLQSIRLPKFVETIFSPFSYILGSTPLINNAIPNPHIQPPRQQQQQQRQYRDQQLPLRNNGWNGNNRNTPSQVPVLSPPPEDAIEALVNLGFEREQAINALRVTNNNVDAAANYLFSGRD